MVERTGCVTEPEAPSLSFQSRTVSFCSSMCLHPVLYLFRSLVSHRLERGWGLQHAGHDNSHSELLADKRNRLLCLIFLSLGNCFFSRLQAWIPCIHPFVSPPQQTGHSLSFPFHPPSSSLRGSLKQGNPRGGSASAAPGSPGEEADSAVEGNQDLPVLVAHLHSLRSR